MKLGDIINVRLDDMSKYYKVGEILRNQDDKEYIVVKIYKNKILVRRYNWFYKLTEKIREWIID